MTRRRRPTTEQQRARERQRGVALLMVLAAVALLYVMAEQSRDEVATYSVAAASSRDALIAEYQAKSGVNLARVLLHAEPTIRRALTPVLAPIMALMGRGLSMPPQIPVWEQADLLLGAFRNREGGQAFGQMVGVDLTNARGLGALSGIEPIVIVDEDSKINVNSAIRSNVASILLGRQLVGLVANPALNPYFEQRDPDGQFTDRATLISNIVDFVDFDEQLFDAQTLLATNASAAGTGTEDSFYQNLRPPYRRRNAPLDSVEELRLVRGLGDDDLWQRAIDPDPGNPRRRTVTVWGQGGVNVNTANAQTVLALICAYAPAALPCMDPGEAMRFTTGITMIQAFTLSMGVPLYTSADGFVQTVQGRPPLGTMLAALGIQPFVLTDPASLARSAAVESKVFSVFSEATIGAAHVRIHAVIDMRPQPALPSTFMRASGIQQQAVVPTASGGLGVVSSQGGTVIYWRED